LQENHHITVAAVIEKDNRFLMVEESIQNQHVINQPAGHLEENETLVEAVIRETLEETAWQFEPEYVTGVYQWVQPENQQIFLRFCFTGTPYNVDKDRKLDQGIIQASWLSHEELLGQQHKLRSPLVLACIDDYLQGQRYPLDIIQNIR